MIKKNFYAILITVAGSGLSILFGIFSARLLMPAEYGLYAFTISLASIVAAIIQLGLSPYSTSYLGANGQGLSSSAIKRMVLIWLLIPIFFGVVLLVIGFNIEKTITDASINLNLLFLLAIMMAQSSILTGVLRGLNYRLSAILPESVMKPLAMLLGLLALFYLYKNSSQALILVTILGSTVSILGLFYFLRKHLIQIKQNKTESIHPYKYRNVLQLWLISLISVASDHASVALVQLVGSAHDVAFFKLAVQCGAFISMIILTISSLYMAEVSRKYVRKEYSDINACEKMVMKNAILISMPVIILVILYSKEITLLLFGLEYLEASSGILLYCVLRYVLMFTGIPGQILMMTNRAQIVFKSWGTTTTLGLLIGTLAFNEYGYKSYLVCMFVGDILNNLFLRTHLKPVY